jgi:hypothetical protein
MFVLGNYFAKSNINLHKAFSRKKNYVTVAFMAQIKEKGRNMSNIQCYSCKEYENIVTIVERSYTIIANTKDILSRSAPLILKIMKSMLF